MFGALLFDDAGSNLPTANAPTAKPRNDSGIDAMLTAYLRTKSIRPDGSSDCHLMQPVPVKSAPMWWHGTGRSYTASGYGMRIPTEYMVQVNGKWRRVYCCIFSNSGTLFIGAKHDGSTIVDIDRS